MCLATRVTAPRGVLIHFECNHFPPHTAALAQNQADRGSLSSWGQKRAMRPCVLALDPISAAGWRSPSSTRNFQLCRRSQARKCKGPEKGVERQRVTGDPARLGATQEEESVNNYEMRKKFTYTSGLPEETVVPEGVLEVSLLGVPVYL